LLLLGFIYSGIRVSSFVLVLGFDRDPLYLLSCLERLFIVPIEYKEKFARFSSPRGFPRINLCSVVCHFVLDMLLDNCGMFNEVFGHQT